MNAEPIVQNIVGCARCHGDGHVQLTFRPLTHPLVAGEYTFSHWATCPTTGEPILLTIRVKAD